MLLLSNGQLLDGSGNAAAEGSLLIDGDRISQVGRVSSPAGIPVIDCRGLTIAPGFIDLHSHSDLQVMDGLTEKLKQGVTTEVVGNCGFSPFPFSGDADSLRTFAAGILGKTERWGWPSAAGYLRELAASPGNDRAFPLVGHGSLRIAVHGLGQEELSAGELDRMCGLLEDSLDAGCIGLSTGLMYAPGSAAGAVELERICRVVARKEKLYASHIRSYAATLVDAVREQIELAERTGCRLQISHLQAAGRDNWHLQEPALEAIEAAHSRGIDVEFDIYPYQCGSTVLTQFLPLWALDGGTPALLRRLENKSERERILDELRDRRPDYWEDVTITSLQRPENASLVGKTVAAIAKLRDQSDADCVVDLLASEQGAVNIVSFNQSESNLRELITHPLCSVITDGFYVKGLPHPRLHGTYPELLGKLVREKNWISLSEAIHKSTAKPARRLRLKDRGSLAVGYQADVVVFDAAHVASHASYGAPAADPSGIRLVIKQGEVLLGGVPS